jgi:methylthioribose-1-phosphate isomerase
MNVEPRSIQWDNGALKAIDQTKLPAKFELIRLKTPADICKAMSERKIRGTTLLGAAASFALVIASRSIRTENAREFFYRLNAAAEQILSSCPGSISVSWALNRISRIAEQNRHLSVDAVRGVILSEAIKIADEDIEINKRIGKNGASLIKKDSSVLTYSNAGALSSVSFGTALGVIKTAHAEGKVKQVFVPETRPRYEGTRLTAVELNTAGIPFKLVCDNLIGNLFGLSLIDVVIVGACKIASNGDVLADAGTYTVAVLAKEHGIRFFVAAPLSVFDSSTLAGADFRIKERSEDEVKNIDDKAIFKKEIGVLNPEFDVTSRQYLTGIITEEGLIKPPFKENIKAALRNSSNAKND